MTVGDAPQITDYPAAVGIALVTVLTALLLFITARLDPTSGVLTISLMVIVAFIGMVMFSLLFVIPTGDTTSSVIGGLIAAFGAVVAFWLGRGKGNS